MGCATGEEDMAPSMLPLQQGSRGCGDPEEDTDAVWKEESLGGACGVGVGGCWLVLHGAGGPINLHQAGCKLGLVLINVFRIHNCYHL